MNTLLVKGGYIVKKDSLTSRSFLRELTVHPESFATKNFAIKDSDCFKVYRESDSRYRIPRFYGIEKFGVPSQDKLQCGITTDIEFNGSLKESLQQVTACNTVINTLNTKGGGILSLPTGYGKTTCALYICCHFAPP